MGPGTPPDPAMSPHRAMSPAERNRPIILIMPPITPADRQARLLRITRTPAVWNTPPVDPRIPTSLPTTRRLITLLLPTADQAAVPMTSAGTTIPITTTARLLPIHLILATATQTVTIHARLTARSRLLRIHRIIFRTAETGILVIPILITTRLIRTRIIIPITTRITPRPTSGREIEVVAIIAIPITVITITTIAFLLLPRDLPCIIRRSILSLSLVRSITTANIQLQNHIHIRICIQSPNTMPATTKTQAVTTPTAVKRITP
mmetsp:Transcript_27774/g.58352  ORF Transcript_27774/g.58352 Transcript_27774/m.58352 type:complete len:264 (-) Transcript_27774:469-1260(-)